MKFLHFFLLSFLLLSSFFVFISNNPVHSVFFLILYFVSSASLLFILGADFLGVLFIIIYVGAVAVLMLFVVMMLDIKNNTSLSVSYFTLFFLLSIFLITNIYLNLDLFFIDFNFQIYKEFFNWEKSIDNLTNINLLGQSLYNYFLSCFLLAGLILLIAMIGAIVLTLSLNKQKSFENTSRQLSRSSNILSTILINKTS